MRYNIHFACTSHIGKVRSINQDNLICDGKYIDPQGEPVQFPLCGAIPCAQQPVFGIFDGMGGEECGEVASLIAARNAAGFTPGKNAVEALSQFCSRANREICRYADDHGVSSMGTTAAMLAFTHKAVVLCNIGDSKIFRLRQGKIEQISTDHLAFAAYGVKPPLSQNLGIPETEMLIDPYFAQGQYHPGDIYLICSDGLTDMVATQDICEILEEHPIQDAVTLLLDRALAAGGRDNTTIILCQLRRSAGLFWGIKK